MSNPRQISDHDAHEQAHPHPHPHDAAAPGPESHRHERRSGLIGRLIELYRPHSHDAADSIDSALESSARGIRATKISLAAAVTVAVIQLLIVSFTGSVALLADAIHSFADSMTSIPLWIAFVVGRRAATRSHTFGFRRAEDLAGLFIVAIIALSAVLIAWESLNRLIEPRPVAYLEFVVLAALVGFVGKEAVAVYRIKVGTEIGSAALVADGHHARADALTSLAVILAAVGILLGFPQADPLVGLAIALAILWILKDVARQVFGRLMDAVDPNLVALVERTAAEVPDVEDVQRVRMRWAGHRLEASLEITVDCDLSIARGHQVGEEVRHALFHNVRGLDEVLVHVDPCGHERTDHHDAIAHHLAGSGSMRSEAHRHAD